MKILLSYSKFHFDPDKTDENKYKNSSAAINARTLYNVLKSFGDVDYIDFSEWEKIRGQSYDLFVGINHNFDKILKYCYIKKSVYYAVNQYPKVRNMIIRKFNNHRRIVNFFHHFKLFLYGILKKSWRASYKYEYAPVVESILSADAIICLGNDVVKKSYIDYGYPEDKFFIINYDLLMGCATPKTKFHKPIRILYVATELCLRKGTDILYDLFIKLAQHSKLDYRLTIVGGGGCGRQYTYLINKLAKKSAGKVSYLGPLFGQKYTEILKANDFYFFPSIEEGQAGTVLDAMYNGLIPLITKESGVDFSPLGFLEPRMKSKKNMTILKSIFDLSDEEKRKLSTQTAQYYNDKHLGFKERLKNILTIIIKQ